MGLFSKISKSLNKTDNSETLLAKELASLNKDGRLHARYLLDDQVVASVTLATGLKGVIKDVSYGGMAVRFDTPEPVVAGSLSARFQATITLLDLSVTCQLSAVRLSQQTPQALFAGLTIHHDGPETLLFLRDFIEPLRWGQSLTEVGAALRHERYQAKEWGCYRGDGPTDLLIRRSLDGGSLEEALLTFRMQDAYCELGLKGGQLKTGRTVPDRDGAGKMPGARIAPTGDVDRYTLRHAIYILSGAPADCRQATRTLMHQALSELLPQGAKKTG